MDPTGIERLAERVLRDVPDWGWDSQTLPVPADVFEACWPPNHRSPPDGSPRQL
jgi:hypothetical protein